MSFKATIRALNFSYQLYSKLKPSVAALSGAISSRSIAKMKFRTRKSFDATGAHSSDTKVTLPGQTGLAWVQLLPHQISSNSKIVCHLAELDSCQKFVKNADFIH